MLLSQQYIKGETVNYESDLRWSHFITNLQAKRYFQVKFTYNVDIYLFIAHQGELEGSRLHKELMEKAKQFYNEAILLENW